MYNKIVNWIDKKIAKKTRERKKLQKEVKRLKEDNLELAMTNDYLLNELKKYKQRYLDLRRKNKKEKEKIKND